MTVGVLAFQGDFAEHIAVLHRLHVPSVEVRTVGDLAKIDALIIPGGESTVIAQFLLSSGVGHEVIRRTKDVRRPLPVYGTCAGMIVLSKKVTGNNAPRTLGLLDITVERNAYGTQVHSFEAVLRVRDIKGPVHASFIRAPKVVRVGKGVDILAEHKNQPVLVRQGNILAGAFHPEARQETAVHGLFIRMITHSYRTNV